VDFALELGALSERVTVSAQVSLLETESASRGGIVDNDLLVNVPNAGRNVYQLAFAMPGVYKPSVNQGTEFSLDGLANSRTAINGAATGVAGTESNTDILIDGTSDAKGDRQVIMIPALDSFRSSASSPIFTTRVTGALAAASSRPPRSPARTTSTAQFLTAISTTASLGTPGLTIARAFPVRTVRLTISDFTPPAQSGFRKSSICAANSSTW
jgi:hypothetical protein